MKQGGSPTTLLYLQVKRSILFRMFNLYMEKKVRSGHTWVHNLRNSNHWKISKLNWEVENIEMDSKFETFIFKSSMLYFLNGVSITYSFSLECLVLCIRYVDICSHGNHDNFMSLQFTHDLWETQTGTSSMSLFSFKNLSENFLLRRIFGFLRSNVNWSKISLKLS